MVLVGPSGSGKSHVGRGPLPPRRRSSRPTPCAASSAAGRTTSTRPTTRSTLLERVVAARLGRGLTTVVDTLGTRRGPAPRAGWRAAASRRAAGRRRRDRHPGRRVPAPQRRPRDRPVPAPTLAAPAQAAPRAVRAELDAEGWDVVHVVRPDSPVAAETPDSRGGPARADRRSSQGLEVVLQVSRFPWGEDPLAWLTGVALAADEAGFAGLAVMDHLIQIPQVDRAWEPIPEPWVTLGAGRRPRHRARARHPGHAGDVPAARHHRQGRRHARRADRRPRLRRRRRRLVGARARGVRPRLPARRASGSTPSRRGIETMRALWAPGTKAYDGERVSLPETTSYPRPVGRIPVIVGGTGERRTLRIAARLGDGCNLPVRRRAARPQARGAAPAPATPSAATPTTVEVTVLDLPVVGTRPRRRLGAGRAAPRPHPRRGVRRAHARRHGRRAAGPVRRPGRPRRRHGVRVDARPRRPGRRAGARPA